MMKFDIPLAAILTALTLSACAPHQPEFTCSYNEVLLITGVCEDTKDDNIIMGTVDNGVDLLGDGAGDPVVQ